MSGRTNDRLRRQRYEAVLAAALGGEEFSLSDAKGKCPAQTPGAVTRVLGELEKDGWLQRFGPESRASFRWKRPRGEFSAPQWIESKVRGAQIPQAPAGDRPRERLLARGAAALRTAELLAILIRTGRVGESALQAGEKITNRFRDDLEKLPDAGRGELSAISPAASEAAYCQIMAGIELGRRVAAAGDGVGEKPERISGPEDAIRYCRQRFSRLAADAKQEYFHVVTLDTKHRVIDAHEVSRGTLNGSTAHPREVFRPAIKDAAAAVILVHNHPSGDPSPSREDIAVTRRLEAAGQHLGIEVLDHVIITRDQSVSIKQAEA